GLARALRAEQQDVRLLQLHLAHERLMLDAPVVVVHRHREDLLGAILPHHVVVEHRLDLVRLGRARRLAARLLLAVLLGDDVVAELDALVADVDRRPRDELAHLALALATEGTGEVGVVVPLVLHDREAPPALARSLAPPRPAAGAGRWATT